MHHTHMSFKTFVNFSIVQTFTNIPNLIYKAQTKKPFVPNFFEKYLT